MALIYKTKGRAREYSPLALNIYDSCDYFCKYCFAPAIMRKFDGNKPPALRWSSGKPKPREGILARLETEARKFSRAEQVLLCFLGDPYCRADVEYRTTRRILEILLGNQVTVAILTKGGKSCLRDLDLFKEFERIKIGATLTFLDDRDSLSWEPQAALPNDRIETLRTLKENGIQTWASLEPVIDIEQSLKIIDETHEFIDHYKVGKLNHYRSGIDWMDFGVKAIEKLNKYHKKFYIKKDLALFIPPGMLTREQTDMDYLVLSGVSKQLNLLAAGMPGEQSQTIKRVSLKGDISR